MTKKIMAQLDKLIEECNQFGEYLIKENTTSVQYWRGHDNGRALSMIEIGILLQNLKEGKTVSLFDQEITDKGEEVQEAIRQKYGK